MGFSSLSDCSLEADRSYLNAVVDDARRAGGRRSSSPRLHDSFGTPRVFCALALASMNQPIELAQAHQFVFEQPSQRIELNRVVLAQDFGGGGELNRIGPPGVVSEPGLNLFDFPPRPLEEGRNYARRRRRSRPRCVACLCMRSWLRCPRLRPQQIARQSRTIRGRRADDLPGRKSCLHSGSRPKWPAWRNRRRLPVRPIQAKARLWSIADGQAVSYLRADCRSISKHRVLLPQQGLDAIEFPIAVGIILG